MKADLHIHTAASGDGEFSPQEIVKLAKENQLQAIAITDHDSINSIESALYWGERYEIEVIPGCEFSAQYKDKWLHVLGYFIDHNNPAIKKWCKKIEKSLEENVDIQIAKLREAGFYLDKDKVVESGAQPMPVSYCRAMFLDHRNNDNKLMNQYRSQENHIIKFCMDWIVTGRPYNAPRYIPGVQDVISLIMQSGGVPVLAHPAATLTHDEDSLLCDLLEFGLMGIEAFTTWHTTEQEEHYYRFCQANKVLATCGSDFHGKTKPHIHIGQVRNNSYEVLECLKDLYGIVKHKKENCRINGIY
ncbi:MAG: putative metal-dependent phosphoesterase, family [Anaerosporomusa subterranea]|jgi:predicted metal-dependent phosphoesterase TrpH|nr:putative metal-dependent phosphoesterase, family [Anaerosporomusa subterranea]